MPDDAKKSPVVQTTDQIYQQTASNIQDQLSSAIGGVHDVIPTNPDQEKEGDNLGDFKDRVIFNRPGNEPSRSFLRRFIERLTKKYPGAQIKLK